MKVLVLMAAFVTSGSLAMAAVETQPVTYTIGNKNFKGVVARDTAVSAQRPGVLVIPEYWGLNDYATSRAKQLAGLGYVAFVADMYGDGKVTKDPKQAGQWSGEVKGNRPMMRRRAMAALRQLRSQPGVEKDNLAAIGYCFGGTGVLELARMNAPVQGVVSFHGGLAKGNAETSETIKPDVLVLHGGADPHVPPAEVAAFKEEMQKANADLEFVAYEGAVHAFTNPAAGNDTSKGAAYDAKADIESWEAMKTFLQKVLGQ